MSRRPNISLRTRATIAFGLTGLAVSVALAAIAFGVARSYLTDQREQVAVNQTYVNARLARSVLRTDEPDPRRFLAGLGGGTASTALVHFRGEWFSASVGVGPDAVPDEVVRIVFNGRSGHQRVRDRDGDLHLAVGVPLAAVEASYFELFPLAELERTLDLLGRALAVGAAGAAVVASVVGRASAGRLVRPLRPVADAAEQIAAGALDTRLDPESDRDLKRLVDAFNAMAAALEARIEREARFAADVSHELRSPLAAVNAALEVIQRRRARLPEEVRAALDVLTNKVESFQQMVLELLEISRIDAGTAALTLDTVDLSDLLHRLVQLHGIPHTPIVIAAGTPTDVVVDRRRLVQSLGNIVDNATRYGQGVTGMSVAAEDDGFVRIAIDDDGPGVAPEERESIFGRFARGQAGRNAGTTSGSGLGLALVVEHIALHHGKVWVEDAPGGGARFVVALPKGGA